MDAATLTQALWPTGNGPDCPQVYALLDGARDDAIAPAIWLSNLPYTCLYAGTLSRALSLAAPYLVQLAPESQFFNTLVNEGWGQAWGIFVVAQPDVTLKALRKHFRTLLRVQDEQGRILVFRFYDPRVLRVYMPTCDPFETMQVLGPVHVLACESAHCDALLQFKLARASLGSEWHRDARGGLMQITRSQLDAMVLSARDQGNARIAAYIRHRFPQAVDDRSLDWQCAFVERLREEAGRYGLSRDDHVATFGDLVMMYGLEFGTAPWAVPILQSSLLDAECKVEGLKQVVRLNGVPL
jgi:hypothetical protein